VLKRRKAVKNIDYLLSYIYYNVFIRICKERENNIWVNIMGLVRDIFNFTNFIISGLFVFAGLEAI